VAAPPDGSGVVRELRAALAARWPARVHPEESEDRSLPPALGPGALPVGQDGRQDVAAGDRDRVRPRIRRVRLRHHPEPAPEAAARAAPDVRAALASTPGTGAQSP